MMLTPTEIKNRTYLLSFRLHGEYRISSNGVPYIVMTCRGRGHSIRWLNKLKRWRIFFPYPSYGGPQERIDLRTEEDVVGYFIDMICQ